jgi:hypothetical protein
MSTFHPGFKAHICTFGGKAPEPEAQPKKTFIVHECTSDPPEDHPEEEITLRDDS